MATPFTLPENECRPLSLPLAGGIEVHEYYLRGKHLPQDNEDGLLATPAGYVAVIDGATSKSAFRLDGKASGRWAMELLAEAISGFPPGLDMPQAVARLTEAVRAFYARRGLEGYVAGHPSHRFTASVVMFSLARREVWQVGDCPCRVGEACYPNAKRIDHLAAEARCAFDQAFLLSGGTRADVEACDPGRHFIRPLLRMQGVFQNRPPVSSPYAYAAIDGFPVPLELVRVYPVCPGEEVVLASDGYPCVLPSLRASEEYLYAILASDPLCLSQFKSTKGRQAELRSFDDRAYVRFTVM